MGLAEPVDSSKVVGHWDYVFDYEEGGHVCGQFLALRDGGMLRRSGGSSSKADSAGSWSTTWRYTEWEPYMHWRGGDDPNEVIEILKGRGYDLAKPSPVPPDQTEAGPFEGIPELAEFL